VKKTLFSEKLAEYRVNAGKLDREDHKAALESLLAPLKDTIHSDITQKDMKNLEYCLEKLLKKLEDSNENTKLIKRIDKLIVNVTFVAQGKETQRSRDMLTVLRSLRKDLEKLIDVLNLSISPIIISSIIENFLNN
jgi:hypothetical protein